MKFKSLVLAGGLLTFVTAASAQNSLFPPEQFSRIQAGVRDIYEMEYARAEKNFQAMISEAPEDPAGYVFLARTYWIKELATKQELSINRFAASDFFEQKPKYRPRVEQDVEERFRKANEEAIRKATARLAKNPEDGSALFLRGLAHQNVSSFETALKRNWKKAAGAGKLAASDHQRLLRIDPTLRDARLSVGAKDYFLGSVPWIWRIFLGLVGYSGNKERGRQTLEAVASDAALVADDARIVLVLIYTREKNYRKAYDHLDALKQKYPHNYLIYLDMGGMELLMNRPENSIAIYGEILRRRNSGERSYAALELAFLYNRLGVAYRHAKNLKLAEEQFRLALQEAGVSPQSATVARLELGRTLDLMKRRNEAVELYKAVAAAEDVMGSRLDAEAFLREPFRAER